MGVTGSRWEFRGGKAGSVAEGIIAFSRPIASAILAGSKALALLLESVQEV
jgi:hypothetical protein